MHEPFFSTEPSLSREFAWGQNQVKVAIWYASNSGPGESGFRAIRDIGLDVGVRKFPVFKAQLESSGFGYENRFGWIQIVVHLREDGSIEDWSPDPFPVMRDRGIPFSEFGYLPSLYDAPFWPERPKLHWRADTFLCPLPTRKTSEEEILPIAGFRWGFKIPRTGDEPVLLPLEVVGREAWIESLPHLRFWFPSWRFSDCFGTALP